MGYISRKGYEQAISSGIYRCFVHDDICEIFQISKSQELAFDKRLSNMSGLRLSCLVPFGRVSSAPLVSIRMKLNDTCFPAFSDRLLQVHYMDSVAKLRLLIQI